ncbi:hypothetical protein [Rhizobium leguminosarum]|uniref:hypothetical protein n=1 Tax=Rhizobium leguminosarum TaxID=384 RepID=UPI00143F7F84|nr:hypothetical protein [Rhizobium leguminosarum]NKL22547.1 hypothetical protein [Rhizobium leguminosarum bv. viciae]
MNFQTPMKHLVDWYEGQYVPYENDRRNHFIIVGGYYERHWTARAARRVVEFWFAHWQWTIGTIIALLALCLTVFKG